MKKIFTPLAGIVLLLACQCNTQSVEKEDVTTMEEVKDTLKTEQYEGYYKVPIEAISNDLFLINHQWMLITSGNETDFNTMTASWGGFGTLWNKPINFMFVRNTRYTFEFLEKNVNYTISFYDTAKYKDVLTMLGTKSGRNTDKIKESGFTPLQMPQGSMAFAEADMIIECSILYKDQLNPHNISSKEILNMFDFYTNEKKIDRHYVFFGEIVSVWKKEK
ncbi:MAG: flavin reductase [Bacteroidales bacterium]|jgi:flavin reductase (DIM6/NTAB) family NADH-FMN oxidoreductase RutF|nr:flavin reductase [Bacteroidales bacterium]